MLTLLLAACIAHPPPLDVKASLDHVCDASPAITAQADHLAVFEGPPPTLAVNVVLRDDLVVDGEWVPPEELEERLLEKAATAQELAKATAQPEFAFRGDLLLQVAATTPAPQVVAVLQAAEAAGYSRIQFVGRSASTRTPPAYADPGFAKVLDATRQQPAEVRQRAYANATDGIMEACPPLLAAMEEVKARPFATRCDDVVEALETSLPECPEADAAKIVTLFQYIPGHDDEHMLTTLPIQLDPHAPPFDVSANETWAEVVPRLKGAGPTTRWIVR